MPANTASQETRIGQKTPLFCRFIDLLLTQQRCCPDHSETASADPKNELIWTWMARLLSFESCSSFPIGVNFVSSCKHLPNQRNASIQVPPVIKSYRRIPEFSRGRPFVKVNLHCFVRAWATHAMLIISAGRFLWCKMTAPARIDRVLRTQLRSPV